jgi:invasion protein IalB
MCGAVRFFARNDSLLAAALEGSETMMLARSVLALAVLTGLVSGGAALAQQKSQFLGAFQDWEAYAGSEGRSKVCYAVTQPGKEEGQYSRRGEVYLFVTHRPGDHEQNAVNVKAGYTYKPGSTVNAAIGNSTFAMYVKDDTAWNRTGQDDRNMVHAMIKGATLVVRGTSDRGTATTDTFSLKGFSAAYQAIGKACGVK